MLGNRSSPKEKRHAIQQEKLPTFIRPFITAALTCKLLVIPINGEEKKR